MKTEIFVHPTFSNLEGFIQQIAEKFSDLGDEIYAGRNEVRLMSIDSKILAVKYFKRITLANRYIFATVRKSKARRAFEYSQRLLDMAIASPQPVAYINRYKYGMLHKSYYISLYTDYLPVQKIFDLPVCQSVEALKAFSRFIYRVQRAGVFHKDLTTINVLYTFENNQYHFSLIDNNRMRFKPYSLKRAMSNMKRLNLPVETIGIIAASYAREAGVREVKILNAMIFNRWRFRMRNVFKKWLKMPLYLLSGKYARSSVIIRKETNLVAR